MSDQNIIAVYYPAYEMTGLSYSPYYCIGMASTYQFKLKANLKTIMMLYYLSFQACLMCRLPRQTPCFLSDNPVPLDTPALNDA